MGEQGIKDVYIMWESFVLQFDIELEFVVVLFIGVIGEYLDMEKIQVGIELLK